MEKQLSIFERLSRVDISGKTKEKNGMSYLPWSVAWEITKLNYPTAQYDIVRAEDGCLYHTDGKTCWVETVVQIEEEIQSETLPVMNYKNQPIAAETINSADVNKSIKRCLTKNLALFGLGLSLWVGEELSDSAKDAKEELDYINSESLKLATDKAKISDEMKVAVGDICKMYIGSGKKNPMIIKDIDTAKALYAELKAL